MTNAAQLAILTRGVDEWNGWRATHAAEPIDLDRANLREANLRAVNLRAVNLREADLSEANLRAANLSEAALSRARLSWADLREANLIQADLIQADLSGANLSRADLSRAVLMQANLNGANLNGANLDGANLAETALGDTDLTGAKGLESCQHTRPSTIDHRTLTRSGTLPLTFLRGVGLPDRLIDYLPSLLGEAIQFYACFISYSTRDQAFAERLYNDLQGKGVRCWFAPEDIQGGKKIHEQIDEAIRTYDKLLLILSGASVASQWVEHELRRARRREERDHRRVLFPIRLIDYERLRDWECFDADSGKDLAVEIREYFIPDFSTWETDHTAYQRAFGRLMRDLQAEGTPPPTASS
jgi:hypothetical protein